ncbi:hypothetical protein FDP41_008101 [Naegleria fowleri]|uniref:Uncharacterized protein n=1 Tax=Naegleria fowleri TaxID=5763 RepID=A0A6A5B748_NAEFO|nr:uncharacterized protein FDP41_008101 [Naegleria fowleri]KAF0973397.1 hypothetical protein FDP41_008101 [Naegleria fowleri]
MNDLRPFNECSWKYLKNFIDDNKLNVKKNVGGKYKRTLHHIYMDILEALKEKPTMLIPVRPASTFDQVIDRQQIISDSRLTSTLLVFYDTEGGKTNLLWEYSFVLAGKVVIVNNKLQYQPIYKKDGDTGKYIFKKDKFNGINLEPVRKVMEQWLKEFSAKQIILVG